VVVEEEAEEGVVVAMMMMMMMMTMMVALMAMKSREQTLHVLCFTCLYMHSRTNAAISLFGSGSPLFFPVDIYQV